MGGVDRYRQTFPVELVNAVIVVGRVNDLYAGKTIGCLLVLGRGEHQHRETRGLDVVPHPGPRSLPEVVYDLVRFDEEHKGALLSKGSLLAKGSHPAKAA